MIGNDYDMGLGCRLFLTCVFIFIFAISIFIVLGYNNHGINENTENAHKEENDIIGYYCVKDDHLEVRINEQFGSRLPSCRPVKIVYGDYHYVGVCP